MTIATRIEAKAGGALRRPSLPWAIGDLGNMLMTDHEKGAGRLERIEAALALVNRAMCQVESEGSLGAAFADDLDKAVRSARAGMQGKGQGDSQPCNGHHM